MAKKQKESAHDAEGKISIGALMKGGKSQRERNLALKAEMIKAGKHPEPKFAPGMSTRERNLALKEELYGKGKRKGKASDEDSE